MNVVMVCPQYHPVIGGYESLARNLARSLNTLGHRCVVVTRRLDRAWPAREIYQDVPVTRLTATRRRGLDGPLWYGGLLGYLLANRRRVDVVHVHQVGMALLATATFSRLTGTPFVAHPHSGAGATVADVRASYKGALLQAALRAAHASVALSDEMADQLRTLGVAPDRILRVDNAVDVDRFQPCAADAERPPTVLYVGRLSPEKGGDVLLRSWPAVRGALPQARLIVVGDGPMRAELEALSRELGVADSIEFRGAVREHIERCYQAADVFVLPSHREGVSVALLEALACGLGVVATRVGGTPEIISDAVSGLLVPPADPGALADGLIQTLSDAGLRARLAHAGRARVLGEFTSAAMAARVAALYARLIEERRP